MVASALLVSTAPVITAPSSVTSGNVIPLRPTAVGQATADLIAVDSATINSAAADQATVNLPAALAAVASPIVTHRIPAGWYPDRENSARRRWWNGTDWTEHYAMPGAALAAEPRPVIPSPRHSAATGPQPVAAAFAAEPTRTHVPLIVIVLLAGLSGADAVLLCLLALGN